MRSNHYILRKKNIELLLGIYQHPTHPSLFYTKLADVTLSHGIAILNLLSEKNLVTIKKSTHKNSVSCTEKGEQIAKSLLILRGLL